MESNQPKLNGSRMRLDANSIHAVAAAAVVLLLVVLCGDSPSLRRHGGGQQGGVWVRVDAFVTTTVPPVRTRRNKNNNNNNKRSLLLSSSSPPEPHSSPDAPPVIDWLQKVLDSYAEHMSSSSSEVMDGDEGGVSHDAAELIPQRSDFTPSQQAAWLTSHPSFFVASHDFLRAADTRDAIYNYGNHVCLTAFGYSWEEFVILPSRYCVRTETEVAVRQELLNKSKEGSSTSSNSAYDGLIRYRKDGTRILLKDVTLWNVYDTDDTSSVNDNNKEEAEEKKRIIIGQAVCIKQVEFLD